jgi:hypothetical protein
MAVVVDGEVVAAKDPVGLRSIVKNATKRIAAAL